MSELSENTDLDTVSTNDRLNKRAEIEKLGILRTDLRALVDFTKTPDLSTALKTINANSVLEVGTELRFEALISVGKAMTQNDSEFSYSNLWAVDPELNNLLHYPKSLALNPKPFLPVFSDQEKFVSRMTKKSKTIQEVLRETDKRLDLVLAKGVASYGAGVVLDREVRAIVGGLADSLNESNKDSVVIISSKRGRELPFEKKMLQDLGLRPVYYMEPTREASVNMHEDPFKLVICKKQP